MNRIDRISAILVQLQSRPVVKASQMAERFGVSIRTIYRDVNTLCEAGVPICGDAGVGYSLVDGYRLPPLMFTKEEAVAFLTAEKFIEQLTDQENSRYFHQGMDKVRAVLKSVDKGYLSDMGNSIEVYRNERLPNTKIPNLLQIILNSISDRKALRMTYYTPSRDSNTERLIETVGVSYIYPRWYLTAFCHFRNEYRNFRMDRIEEILITDEEFSRKHPPLKELVAEYDNPQCLQKVVVHTASETARKMGDVKFYMGLVSEKQISEDILEQTYMSYSLDNMARWILSNGDTTKVIEPDEIKERIRGIINDIVL